MERWWRARDLEALPYFFFGQEEDLPGSPTDLQTTVFSKVKEHPELLHWMALMMEHQISPYDVFPPSKIFHWTLAALLKGKFHVLSEFKRMGQRIFVIQKGTEISEKAFSRRYNVTEPLARGRNRSWKSLCTVGYCINQSVRKYTFGKMIVLYFLIVAFLILVIRLYYGDSVLFTVGHL